VSRPTVTVVIAVYNDARHLARAIESVRAQDYPDIELIVVDDGSSDASAQTAERCAPDRLVVLERNEGPSFARNVGVALARGEMITFLDADDRMFVDRVRRQLEFLDECPEYAAVLIDQALDIEPGVQLPSWLEHLHLTHTPVGGSPISPMVPRRLLLEFGGFDPAIRMGEDTELLMRLERAGRRVAHLEMPLMMKTYHGNNATNDNEGVRSGLLSIVRGLFREPPEVSLIVPVFDGASYLAQAIESLLAQDVEGMEIVVVDDGSSDDSHAVALACQERDARVRAFRQPHAGPGAARNLGLLLARGAYVGLLDADDLAAPGRVAAQLARLRGDPGLGLCFGVVEEFVDDGTESGTLGPRPAKEGHIPSALLARRSAVAEVGPFPTDPNAVDWPEWYIRAVEGGASIDAVPEVVARRRLHGRNLSLELGSVDSDYLGLLRSSLLRRRVGSPPA
jgi:glycosyltransferase involved in cell wall biosynthesis